MKNAKACRTNQEREHNIFLKTVSSQKRSGKRQGKPGPVPGRLHMPTKDIILKGRTVSLSLLC